MKTLFFIQLFVFSTTTLFCQELKLSQVHFHHKNEEATIFQKESNIYAIIPDNKQIKCLIYSEQLDFISETNLKSPKTQNVKSKIFIGIVKLGNNYFAVTNTKIKGQSHLVVGLQSITIKESGFQLGKEIEISTTSILNKNKTLPGYLIHWIGSENDKFQLFTTFKYSKENGNYIIHYTLVNESLKILYTNSIDFTGIPFEWEGSSASSDEYYGNNFDDQIMIWSDWKGGDIRDGLFDVYFPKNQIALNNQGTIFFVKDNFFHTIKENEHEKYPIEFGNNKIAQRRLTIIDQIPFLYGNYVNTSDLLRGQFVMSFENRNSTIHLNKFGQNFTSSWVSTTDSIDLKNDTAYENYQYNVTDAKLLDGEFYILSERVKFSYGGSSNTGNWWESYDLLITKTSIQQNTSSLIRIHARKGTVNSMGGKYTPHSFFMDCKNDLSVVYSKYKANLGAKKTFTKKTPTSGKDMGIVKTSIDFKGSFETKVLGFDKDDLQLNFYCPGSKTLQGQHYIYGVRGLGIISCE